MIKIEVKGHIDGALQMTEQKFWEIVRRHEQQYSELMQELQDAKVEWDFIDALATGAARSGEWTRDEVLSGKCPPMNTINVFIRNLERMRSKLNRLQRKMSQHCLKAPPRLLPLLSLT